ncbi:MAG: hypothetical protein KAG97_13245, partial [Victivallales bacterium]|nr:hypothetical protein [Victivallales bacterium]
MKYSAGKSTKRLFSSWWAPAIFAVSAVLAVYLPSVFYPFVGYDDNPYIILNPYLGNLDIDSLIGIWRSGGCAEENLYIPLTYTTYFIETGIFGKAPLPIHLDNVLLHLTNTSLFLFLLRRLGFARGTALVAVLAFALHPLQVEPVVWCMGRKDLLSVFLALLAIIAYSRPFSPNDDAIAAESSCRGPDAASNGSNSRKGFLSSMSLSVFLGLAAMLSKPVMIVLPAILLAYELCFRVSKDKCDSTLSSWTFRLRNFDRERLGAVFALGASAVGVLCVNLLGSFRVPLHAASTRLCLVVSYASAEWLKRFLMFGTMQHQYIWPSDSDLASPLNTVISLLAAGLAFAILHR